MSRLKSQFSRFVLARRWMWFCLTIALVTFYLAKPVDVYAEEFEVTTTEDSIEPYVPDQCSLRAAISAANVAPGADGILLPAGTYVLTLTGAEEDGNLSGDLDITGSLVITGTGATRPIIDGNNTSRIFDITDPTFAGYTVLLQNLTLRNGMINDSGGAVLVRNSVTLRLNHTVVRDNESTGGDGGGAFYIQGTATSLIVENSAIISNTALGKGGAIVNNGRLRLENTTLSGNSTNGSGGGIHNNSAELNSANNATIAYNIANTGPGIHVMPGTSFVIQNTIVAQNHTDGDSPLPRDCSGDLSSNGNNLIGNSTGCQIATTGSDILDADPLLQPLASFAGSPPLHPLTLGSPAIDAGYQGAPSSNSCLAVDQRGINRPQDGNFDGTAVCDIGAFELRVLRIYIPIVLNGAS